MISFWETFGINFQYFFCIEFYMSFWMPLFEFWSKMVAKRLPKTMSDGSVFASFSRPFPNVYFFMHFGRPFAHFWIPFGSRWLPFGSLWLTFRPFFSADVAEACRFLASHLLASSGRYPRGAAVSLCVYNDILKVWHPGRSKNLLKTQHRFLMGFASILEAMLMIF